MITEWVKKLVDVLYIEQGGAKSTQSSANPQPWAPSFDTHPPTQLTTTSHYSADPITLGLHLFLSARPCTEGGLAV